MVIVFFFYFWSFHPPPSLPLLFSSASMAWRVGTCVSAHDSFELGGRNQQVFVWQPLPGSRSLFFISAFRFKVVGI
ncbi:hypothetical protein L209DRAFT_580716 [Thermothelomyces heterothallicus CBS 203.75]